eukprot:890547_1
MAGSKGSSKTAIEYDFQLCKQWAKEQDSPENNKFCQMLQEWTWLEVRVEQAKYIIQRFLNSDKFPRKVIYFTGHSDMYGNWCFVNGKISYNWIRNEIENRYNAAPIAIWNDCC